ncbi:hypothetical protein DPMN_039710 [Dreissena polymorpha]|uniref:Uncharacterized protein n=1 Tax=Dreissena polymorpha TaxID=45954 RepID=A0A9D4HSF4_DREPO|nr:hypothetical protein DPMN_039710 [Dreissena polymorpha]
MGLFLVVMIVILLAYGIAAQGLLYTERSPSWAIIKDVFYFPYWMIYGEIFFKSIGECDGGKYVTIFWRDCCHLLAKVCIMSGVTHLA